MVGRFVEPDTATGATPDAPGDPIGTRTTYFALDSDPFVAFDDVASQLRASAIDAPMSGTSDACLWQADRTTNADGGAVATAPAAPAARTTGTSSPSERAAQDNAQAEFNRQEREQFERLLVTDASPPDGLTGVSCQTRAAASAGPTPTFGLVLAWSEDGEASMTLTEESTPLPGGARSQAQVTSFRRQLQGAEQTIRDPGTDRVPAIAATRLRSPGTIAAVATGGQVGPAASCLAGRARFRLPANVRLAGVEIQTDQPNPVAAAVLAVEPADVNSVLTDLESQATKDGFATSDRRTVPLARGGSATVVSLTKASDEDYGCGLLVSPDRTRIRITSSP